MALPQEIARILYLNPMARLIDISHNAVLYDVLPSPEVLLYTVIMVIIVFFSGYGIFKRLEKRVVEEL